MVHPTRRSRLLAAVVIMTAVIGYSRTLSDKVSFLAAECKTGAGTDSAKDSERVLEGHTDNIYALALTPDGERLVSASEDGTARIWDWRRGKCLARLDYDGPVYDASFSPDGKLLAVAMGDGQVEIRDADSLRKRFVLTGHVGPVYALAFSPDARWLATGGGEKDFTCRVWDVATGKEAATLTGHDGAIYGVAFSPSGLLATSSEDRTVRLWNWQRKEGRVLRGHTSYVYRCRFSPDGRVLASASHDRTVRLWDVEQGNLRAMLGPFRQAIYAMAFDALGHRLAWVGEEHRVCIGKLLTGPKESGDGFACAEEIRGPRDAVYAVTWFGNARSSTLFFGGGDRKIVIVPK